MNPPWPYNTPGTTGLDYDAAVWTALNHHWPGTLPVPRDEWAAWCAENRRRVWRDSNRRHEDITTLIREIDQAIRNGPHTRRLTRLTPLRPIRAAA